MTLRRASLVFSVGRDLLFAVLVGGAAVLVSLSAQLEMTKQELRERSLDASARDIADHLVVEPDGTARVVPATGDAAPRMGYPTLVFDRDGRIIYQRPSDLDLALVAALSGQRLMPPEQPHQNGAIRFFDLALGKRLIVGATLQTGASRGDYVIEVFKDETAPDVLIDDIVREFPYRSIAVLLPLLALLMLAAGGILWHRMRPIAEVSRLAGTIGPTTLYMRLPENDVPAEVQPIVRAVNGALARLERAAEAQHEFLRHAAHQLRTPMTVLSARAASLEDSETTARLRGDVDELARIVGQLLQLNEIDALPYQDDAVADLGAVAEAARDELKASATKRQIRLELNQPIDPVLVKGNPNVIEIALRNLVENALQHSPPAGTVKLCVTADREVAVSDSGPGVADELRDKIFEPFWSSDREARRAGLGLTIVRRIAERYGARATVDTRAGGGARFALRFLPPAATGITSEPTRSSLPAGLARRRDSS